MSGYQETDSFFQWYHWVIGFLQNPCIKTKPANIPCNQIFHHAFLSVNLAVENKAANDYHRIKVLKFYKPGIGFYGIPA